MTPCEEMIMFDNEYIGSLERFAGNIEIVSRNNKLQAYDNKGKMPLKHISKVTIQKYRHF